MSQKETNGNVNKDINSKNLKYILSFTAVAIMCIVFFLIYNNSDKNQKAPAVANNAVTNNRENVTVGNQSATIDKEISLRNITFPLSKDDVNAIESSLDDTLNNPFTSDAGGGFSYVTYKINPDNPFNYNGVSVNTDDPNSCIMYSFQNDFLTEAKFQFGLLPENDQNTLVSALQADYGKETFYRSSNGCLEYWWKSETKWLFLVFDNAGASISLRQNTN